MNKKNISQTKERLLPTFYSDNYISVLSGEAKTIIVQNESGFKNAEVELDGWNTGNISIKLINNLHSFFVNKLLLQSILKQLRICP